MILAYFRSLAARFFHRSQTENDLEEELRSHIQLRADDLERFGLGGAEAKRRARIEFGGEAQFAPSPRMPQKCWAGRTASAPSRPENLPTLLRWPEIRSPTLRNWSASDS